MSELEQKQVSTGNTLLCPCGAPRKPWRPYCVRCSNARRASHSEIPTEARRRANARSYLNQYVRRGKITKGPCAECGNPEVEAHHADYSKPLDVTWLCRNCHLKLHGVVICRRIRSSKADQGKPPELFAFYNALHERGVKTDQIAKEIGVSGGAVRRLIGGHRKRRGPIWNQLLGKLTPREIELLDAAVAADRRPTKQPLWTPEKAQRLAQSHAA